MKVSELIEILQKAGPNDLVVLSKDGEGNGYDTLCDVSLSYAFVEGLGHGDNEIKLRKLTPELEAKGYTKEDTMSEYSNAKPCVVLWP